MTIARRAQLAACTVGALALLAPAARAQSQFPNVKVAGRLHVQGYWFDNQDYAPSPTGVGPESNFFVRRARIQVNGQISENVSLVIQPSFENAAGREPNLRLRDAYIDVRLTPEARRTSVTWRFGQEKRPFSRWELTSSNNLVVIERGAGRGLLGRQTNDLFGSSGFLAHDLGTSLIVASHDVITVQAGMHNGRGESLTDDNSAKSFGARATLNPLPKVAPTLSLGAAFFSHDGVVALTAGGADSSFRNNAFEIDGQWGRPGDAGPYALVELAQGKSFNEAKTDMRGISALAAYNYRFKSPTSWLYAIEPAVRWDDADPDTDAADNRSTLASAVLGFYFSSRAQFRIAYERQMFENDALSDIGGIRTAMTVNF